MIANRLHIIIICCFFNIFSTSAQSNGNVSGHIEYQIIYPTVSTNPKPLTAQFYFNNTKSISIDNKKDNDKGSVSGGTDGLRVKLPYGDELGAQIFRNLENRIIITRRPKNFLSDAFIVQENWIDIDWEIKSNTKEIGPYTATKAVGAFRGATYTVWFTYDIPVPFGPWKLHGLPGLILEGEDSQKMMRFTVSKITIPFENADSNLQTPTAANQKSHKEEVYMLDNFDKLKLKIMNSKMKNGHYMSLPPDHKPVGRKYKPEKIYEWEIGEKDDNKK